MSDVMGDVTGGVIGDATGYVIRPVVESDRGSDKEGWQSLYQAYADFYQVEMNDAILQQVWKWIFDPEEPFYALLAEDQNGQALGLMHFRAMASPLRGCKVGFLDDLFIASQARNSGLADQMFAALSQQAQGFGWPLVRWITAENNYRARAVYDRLANKTQWQMYQLNCL